MNPEELAKKIADLESALDEAYKVYTAIKSKEEDLKLQEEELANRERIVEKEKVISRERKELLDAREKNIEATEARLQRRSQV